MTVLDVTFPQGTWVGFIVGAALVVGGLALILFWRQVGDFFVPL